MIRHTVALVLGVVFGGSWAGAETPDSVAPQGAEGQLARYEARLGSDWRQSPLAGPNASFAPHELFGDDRPGHPKSGEHPLRSTIRWAVEGLPAINNLRDYSATMAKRERIKGKLGKEQFFFIKIRQKPFSVYMLGLAPRAIKGEEVIYVAGRNDGKLWAHPAGLAGNLVHAISLKPDGPTALCGERYPITEIGIANLAHRLIVIAEKDTEHNECEVKYFSGAKVNGRACTCCQVVHPVPRSYFGFYLGRIFVDDQLKLPVRYEAYAWPSKTGDDPPLLEEYSYVSLKLDNGFTDEDFSIENPAYHFR